MIGNLLEWLVEAHYQVPDERFQVWAKRLKAVDDTKSNGYAFEGPWVGKGTIEFEPGPALFLVAVRAGSRKNNHGYYAVIEMAADGSLTDTGIRADDKTPGWALRIREQVAERLAELKGNPPPAPDPAEQLAAIRAALAELPADEADRVPAALRAAIEK